MHVMTVLTMLRCWIADYAIIGHKARVEALLAAVIALLKGDTLTLTTLGRNRDGAALSKHKIKAIDRLLGNYHRYKELMGFYTAMAATLLMNVRKPVILVDWADTGVTTNDKLMILRAAVPVKGRSMVIYEEVHPESKYNNDKVHRTFIRRLMSLLPEGCKPIVVTDAGYRVPWYQDVLDHGGHFLGRVRGKVRYQDPETKDWSLISTLYAKATARIRHIGSTCLTVTKCFSCKLYLVRGQQRKTGKKRTARNKSRDAKYQLSYKTPWLLATSLPHERGTAKLIKRIYSQRMQIEENFRDLKSHRFGFGLRDACTKSPERGAILLLIAAVATLALWLLGFAGTTRGIARHFQANTIRNRAVLSIVYLGKEVWKNQKFIFTLEELNQAMEHLKKLLFEESQYA